MPTNEFKFSLSLNDCIFHIRSREKRGLPVMNGEDDIVISSFPETAGLHMHYFMELQYLYNGEMEVTTNGTRDSLRRMKAGELLFIPQELYHSTNPIGNPVRFGCTLSLECNKKFAGTGYSDFMHFSKIFNSIKDVTVVNDSLINTYMMHSNDVANSGLFHTSSYQGAIILAVILRFAEIQYQKSEIPIQQNITYTSQEYDRKWIIENFIARSNGTNHTISELSKELFLSDRQTRTVVKKIMGDDFKNLMIKQKIDLANVLIKNSDMSLEEIAERVGYNSYSSFYTAYVKLMGFSPNKMKNQK